MPAWSNISCAQWMFKLRLAADPFSNQGVRPAANSRGMFSRAALIRPHNALAVPTLTCTITACAVPVTKVTP